MALRPVASSKLGASSDAKLRPKPSNPMPSRSRLDDSGTVDATASTTVNGVGSLSIRGGPMESTVTTGA